jgi:hypothetical protein
LDALFRFTDRMTQDERLPGWEKDAGVWVGNINYQYRISTALWNFPAEDSFIKPEFFSQ